MPIYRYTTVTKFLNEDLCPRGGGMGGGRGYHESLMKLVQKTKIKALQT